MNLLVKACKLLQNENCYKKGIVEKGFQEQKYV